MLIILSKSTLEKVIAKFFNFFRLYIWVISSKFLQFKICNVCSLSDLNLGIEVNSLTELISNLSKFKQLEINEKSDYFLQLINAK